MAFGYKLPDFNLWGRMWYRMSAGTASSHFQGPFYFPCQFKYRPEYNVNVVMVPPRLGFRPLQQTPDGLGDILQVSGNENMWWIIISVLDVGSGYFNEHRQMTVIQPTDQSDNSERGLFVPAVRTGILPPEDAVMVPETIPLDGWDDPGLFFWV